MWQIRKYDMKHFWDENYKLMELIKEVPEEPETDCILEIDGKNYRWCAVSHKERVYGVKEITLNQDPEEEAYGDFKCPYCGSVDDDAWERPDDGTVECGSCGSKIEYERNVEVTYTVTPVKMAKIVRL
ncbi:TFIIB-type zinc ribbon-containing protein [Paenibacillus polymyxa]|uniref:TFIIB-type zinc ribbon-containing protein n=1 Tax=Paenibacillus TaxID=44249 RepID=UPI0020259F6B|nr:TFIIB-type zinc ribbon-containing protein [Paenibacillus polymyxa]URJ42173.1 TFIIB-type zinc ribbon-containing protein [Paenibacillus polymyxa]